MKRYLAVELSDGVHIFNDYDELGGLIDLGIKHDVIGEVCDNQEFGDNCGNCQLFHASLCKFTPVKDVFGKLWHVVTQSIINNMDDETYKKWTAC